MDGWTDGLCGPQTIPMPMPMAMAAIPSIANAKDECKFVSCLEPLELFVLLAPLMLRYKNAAAAPAAADAQDAVVSQSAAL